MRQFHHDGREICIYFRNQGNFLGRECILFQWPCSYTYPGRFYCRELLPKFWCFFSVLNCLRPAVFEGDAPEISTVYFPSSVPLLLHYTDYQTGYIENSVQNAALEQPLTGWSWELFPLLLLLYVSVLRYRRTWCRIRPGHSATHNTTAPPLSSASSPRNPIPVRRRRRRRAPRWLPMYFRGRPARWPCQTTSRPQPAMCRPVTCIASYFRTEVVICLSLFICQPVWSLCEQDYLEYCD